MSGYAPPPGRFKQSKIQADEKAREISRTLANEGRGYPQKSLRPPAPCLATRIGGLRAPGGRSENLEREAGAYREHTDIALGVRVAGVHVKQCWRLRGEQRVRYEVVVDRIRLEVPVAEPAWDKARQ